eukprot:gnl/TRDRNA2_/TRDRNA2_156682_c1_seq4.p2 gnl/TRDRNA2_/TRDRNA2_156682_c1~~gnl/TRDRNA2_/TRDRNA2_156682_c1_seq4.p2  ORF type:complete len:109 (+),score=8.36 gnl/TRDRNA2_/TRDRNA2_156682_c1_seq4:231-557(+)
MSSRDDRTKALMYGGMMRYVGAEQYALEVFEWHPKGADSFAGLFETSSSWYQKDKQKKKKRSPQLWPPRTHGCTGASLAFKWPASGSSTLLINEPVAIITFRSGTQTA